MKNRFKISSICYFILWINAAVFAQYPLTINVNVSPPYSPYYQQYINSPNGFQITILNNSSETKQIYLSGSILNTSDNSGAFTNPENPWPGAAISATPGISTFMGTDLSLFVSGANYTLVGLDETQLIQGILPEGDYQICLGAYDYLDPSHPPLSDPDLFTGNGCSSIFSIIYPTAPITVYPTCGVIQPALTPQTINFTWISSMGVPAGAMINYDFKLVYYPSGTDISTALNSVSNLDVVYQESNIGVSSLFYGPDKPPLIHGKRYAWQVRAYDPSNQTVFQNSGVSEPCDFYYTSSNSTDGVFSLDYPITGDTIPWNFFPLLSKFNPYNNDYSRFRSNIEILGESINDEFSRNLSWPNGPTSGQSAATELQIFQLNAVYIGIYKRSDEAPANNKFKRGARYDWNASISMDGNGDPEGDIEGFFHVGMGKPQPKFPKQNDTIYLGDLVDNKFFLNFLNANTPTKILPELDILQTSEDIEDNGKKITGTMDERWVSEISKSENFSQILFTRNERIGQGINVVPSEGSENCLADCIIEKIYKENAHEINLTESGWYYWRIRWLKNPELETGESYLSSSIVKFYVAEGKKPIKEETAVDERQTPESCIAAVDGPIIPEDKKVPSNEARKDSILNIGLFKVKITQITWIGFTGKGEGEVFVPYLKAPIRVEFNNIKVNIENQIYEGELTAMYENATVVPPAWIQSTGMMADLTKEEVKLVENSINGGGRLVSQLTSNNPTSLPIGIDQNVDGVPVIIGVVAMKFTPERASFNAMVNIDFTDAPWNLAFGAMDIAFHPFGIGGAQGRKMLYLARDVKSKSVITPGDSTYIFATKFEDNYNTVSDSGTFVSFDCLGFKSLAVKGKFTFSRDDLVEDLPDGTVGNSNINAAFNFKIARGKNVLARLDFNKPFQITGAEGWGFKIDEAWLDFSDIENPPNAKFPTNFGNLYDQTTNTYSITQAWNGFYLKKATLGFPKVFQKFGNDARISAGVENLIIDRLRLTAQLRVYNVFNVDDGNLGGWGFSLDTLMMDFVDGSYTTGGFKGKLQLPSTNTPILYSSLLKQTPETNDWDYEFLIKPEKDLNAEFLKATLNLDESSFVSITIADENKPEIKAELTGNMSINSSFEKIGNVNFQLMNFQKFTFQNQDPYISCQAFSFNSPQKFIGGKGIDAVDDLNEEEEKDGNAGGFPINISDIKVAKRSQDGNQLGGVEFNLNLNLTGDVNTFSATGHIAILGKIDLTGARAQHWSYEKIDLDSVGVKGEVGPVKIEGYVKFYEGDAVYGDGLKGKLLAEFKPRIKVQAMGQFGNVNGNRYWFVDAQTVFNPGIPIFAGINAYGFGGGAWYHMEQTTLPPLAKDLKDTDLTDEMYAPGLSLSGVTYIPKADVSIGVKATMVFGTMGNEEAFNGDVTLSFQTGVSSFIQLDGSFYMMTELEKRTDPQLWSTGFIKYDFANDELAAQFDFFVNVKGGLVKGASVSPLNRAGKVELLVNSDNWHIFAGTPTSPIQIKFINLFNSSAYFMLGTDLPAPPGPPDNFDLSKIQGEQRNEAAIEGGSGIAFGAKATLNETIQFLFLEFRMDAGIGFDLSVMKRETGCEGMGPGELPGVNGWYAQGQIYGYLTGGVSLYVDLLLFEGTHEVATISASAILSGGFPNPSYAVGYASVSYSCFGGAITGNHDIKIPIGEKCEPQQKSILNGAPIISDMVPAKDEGKIPRPPGIKSPGAVAPNFAVDCGVFPEAVFNLKIDKEFEINELKDNGDRVRRKFRVKIESFTLSQGDVVESLMEISLDGLKVMLVPSNYLLPQKEHTLTLKIYLEEFTQANGWRIALNKGVEMREQKIHKFMTDVLPVKLRPDDIAYTYPFHNQRYFLKEQTALGVLKMHSINQSLFKSPNGNIESRFFMRFTSMTGGPYTESEIDFKSISKDKSIYFDIPDLTNDRVYAADLIRRDSFLSPLSQIEGAFANAIQVTGQPQTSSSSFGISSTLSTTVQNSTQNYGVNVKVRNLKIVGRTLRNNEKLLYTFFFKTSKFNNVAEKSASLIGKSTPRTTGFGFEFLEPYFDGPEKFDIFDIKGYNYSRVPGYSVTKILPIVKLSEARTDNWNDTWANPIIYKYYRVLINGFTTLRFDRATPDTIGIPPIKTIRFHKNTISAGALSAAEIKPSNGFSMNTPMSITTGTGNSNPAEVQFMNYTALWTRIDYIRLEALTNSIFIFTDAGQNVSVPEPLKSMRQRYWDSTWNPLYKGEYGLRLGFVTPDTKLIPVFLPNSFNKSVVAPYVKYTYQ